jgi:protein arginine kinase activator
VATVHVNWQAMNCDVCKSTEATVFLTQIVQGKMQKANLCEGCASNKGVTDPTGFALADLLAGIGAEQRQEAPSTSGEKSCGSCGFTQSDFKKTGRLGCSHCFQVFGSGLESLLKAMHKGTRHVGKIPSGAEKSQVALGQLADLKTQLETAVNEERYEDAAALRDKIHQLSKDADDVHELKTEVGDGKLLPSGDSVDDSTVDQTDVSPPEEEDQS